MGLIPRSLYCKGTCVRLPFIEICNRAAPSCSLTRRDRLVHHHFQGGDAGAQAVIETRRLDCGILFWLEITLNPKWTFASSLAPYFILEHRATRPC